MKLCNILLLASILPVGESNGSSNPPPKKKADSTTYSQIARPHSPAPVISKQPKTTNINFMRAESPISSTSTPANTTQSSKKPYLPEGDQTTVYRNVGYHVSILLAANNLLEDKTLTTKHGYIFKVNNDPKNTHFDQHTTEERFAAVATQWQNKLLDAYKSAIQNKKYGLADDAHSLLKTVIFLADREWKKAPEIELPRISTAQALTKYAKAPFYAKLTEQFASKEKVSQKEVDDYAHTLELPTNEALKGNGRADFLKKVFGQKESLLPDDVKKLSEHDQKFQHVLQQLPPRKHDRESVCSGCAFFENEAQHIISLHDNMETTPQDKRLEVQTRAAIAKLADPKVFNIKEESITAIDTSLKACGTKIYELEQKIAKKRTELAALLKISSQNSSVKKEKLTPLQETSSISCPRTPSDVEKLHQEIALLENSVKDLKIDLATLSSSKEWATEARALQKAVLLQLASNVDIPVTEVPTITLAQRTSLWGMNPFGVTLPAKTAETPSALFIRIAHEETKKKHPDEASRGYLAMYRRLTSASEAIRWTDEQKQLQQAENTLEELENAHLESDPVSLSTTDSNA